MHKKLINTVNVFEGYCIRALASKQFFWLVICLFTIQALWVVFSIRYPILFDEVFHFEVIKVFGHQISPIVTNQPIKYDIYGNLTFGSASLYHYLLSYPYRLVASITADFTVQVIFLRIINVLMATTGLFVFARLFKAIGIKQLFINLSIFFFSLIPIVTLVSATISYDNLLFLLTAWFFLLGVQILQTKDISASRVLQFVIVGIFASLVKFTFLPIFVSGLVFVIAILFKKYGKHTLAKFTESVKNVSKSKQALLIVLFIVISSFFVGRYLVPIIKYGSPIPDCGVTLSRDRCLVSNVYKYESGLKETKLDRPVEPPQQYVLSWLKNIVMQLDTSAAVTPRGTLVGIAMPIFAILMATGAYIGVVALLIAWRKLDKNIGWYFLITMTCVLLATVLLFNAMSYYSAHLDINTQTRYLLSVFPIVMVMSLVAINDIIGNRHHIKFLVLVMVLLLCTQGGGIIKPILNANNEWYWQNSVIIETNNSIKNLIAPLVQE